MIKIGFVNQKGGVAKTTSIQNVAAGLAKLRKKVLVIDFDPQGNATSGLGIDPDELKYTLYDLFRKEFDQNYRTLNPTEVIIKKHGFDIVPVDPLKLKVLEKELNNEEIPSKENLLKEIIQELEEINTYDFILIDSAPTLGFFLKSVLIACDKVYIPVQPESYAIEGLKHLLDEIERIKYRGNKDLKIGGVFITMVDPRTNIHIKVKEDILDKYFADVVFNTFIRRYIENQDAIKAGMPLLNYNPQNKASLDYMKLVEEIIEREGV